MTMRIEESYLAVSGIFDRWVRVMEYQTRLMEVQDSRLGNSRILIISPPTDRGIKLLIQANATGESHLLCFSEALADIAKDNSVRCNLKSLKISVEPFFSIPFDNNHFDAIFTNCFFDFCQESAFNDILKEIKRALKKDGELYSVFMDTPTGLIGKAWAKVFDQFQSISKGCHPVDIIPCLLNSGFKLKKKVHLRTFGFPLKYLIAEGQNSPHHESAPARTGQRGLPSKSADGGAP